MWNNVEPRVVVIWALLIPWLLMTWWREELVPTPIKFTRYLDAYLRNYIFLSSLKFEAASLNCSSQKIWTRYNVFYIVYEMADDDLATQWAMTSTAMVLTSRIDLFSGDTFIPALRSTEPVRCWDTLYRCTGPGALVNNKGVISRHSPRVISRNKTAWVLWFSQSVICQW